MNVDLHPQRILSLCSGVAWLDIGVQLGLEQLGARSRVVAYCERDAYAQAVLLARMEEASLEPAPVCNDLADINEGWRGSVDLIVAGIPCQPWSHAGKQCGAEDERWIWPDVLRAIRIVHPAMVFIENVPGFVSGCGLNRVLDDLARDGFDADWLSLTAEAVGASHRRNRIFVLAYRAWARSWRVSESGNGTAAADTEWDRPTVGNSGRNGRRQRKPGRRPSGRTVVGWASESLADSDRPNAHEPDTSRGHRTAGTATERSGKLADAERLGSETGGRVQPSADQPAGGDAIDPGLRCGDVADSASAFADIRQRIGTEAGTGCEPRPERCGATLGDTCGERAGDERQSGIGQPEQQPRRSVGIGGPSGIFPPGPGLGGNGVLDDIRDILSRDPAGAWRRYQAELANTMRWSEILAGSPWLAPAIEPGLQLLAYGEPLVLDASRRDQFRCSGNGCVPLHAAIAFVELMRRAMK